MLNIWHHKTTIHTPLLLQALFLRQRSPMVPLRESSNHSHPSMQISHLTFLQPIVVTSQPRIVIERGETGETEGTATETETETETETTAIAIGAPLDTPVADALRLPLALPLVNVTAAIIAPEITAIRNTDNGVAPEIVIARATAVEQALKRVMRSRQGLVHWLEVSWAKN
jgi:hypothetical protein